jgi:hypothetical protein
MQPISDPRLVADQMLMADDILTAIANGTMPMHPAGYLELASWARESFAGMHSGALRILRDAAPKELQGIVENVLHERGVISWAADPAVGLSAMAACAEVLGRCRLGTDRGH